MNADQPQFEKYWRERIGNEVLDIILKSYNADSTSVMSDVYQTITGKKQDRNII